MNNKYKPVIGLEIHVELKTKSGMFCQCRIGQFKDSPNSHVCPVCLGLPGALPVPNKKAIEWTIKIGQALNCYINRQTKFDRKHYSYPDLAKGYQISQYDEPIAVSGHINFRGKTFRINRVHLEEDTGKLMHVEKDSLIDFNRSGTPLVEIVTEPDFDSSDDVKAFLEELHTIIRYLDVSEAELENGTMRMEPNISVRVLNGKKDVKELPKYKVEVKNINSFRFVKQAIDYEVKRQISILEKGELPTQETRGFDEKKVNTYSQRTKEEAQDYRYFPEPDIPPLSFTEEYLEKIKNQLPELPQAKLERYQNVLKLKSIDAFIITRDFLLSKYFEEVCQKIKEEAKKKQVSHDNLNQHVANLIINKKVSSSISVSEFVKNALAYLAPKTTDENALNSAIDRILKANQKVVAEYKSGKQNALMFLVGQLMREMRGKVDAKAVISKIKDKISK